MLNALTLGGEAGSAIELIHPTIKRLMRSAQVRRHQVRIVEVGQCRAGMHGASAKHGQRQRLRNKLLHVEAARNPLVRDAAISP